MEYWMSFEAGTGFHGRKGAVLHRVMEQFRQNFKSTYEVFIHDHSQN